LFLENVKILKAVTGFLGDDKMPGVVYGITATHRTIFSTDKLNMKNNVERRTFLLCVVGCCFAFLFFFPV
jgi:hypothetical protein